MLKTSFAARRHHDRVTLLEFELHTSTCSWKRRSNRPQSLRQLDCPDLGVTQLAAGLELNTKKKLSLSQPSYPFACTPFIPRKETGNGLVRACMYAKCQFCRDLQKQVYANHSFLCTMHSLQKIQCNQTAFKAQMHRSIARCTSIGRILAIGIERFLH